MSLLIPTRAVLRFVSSWSGGEGAAWGSDRRYGETTPIQGSASTDPDNSLNRGRL